MNTGDQRVLTIKETSPNSITVHSTYSGSGDEGTAMLEIIHDLAPDADLYFAGMNGYTSSDMVSAIEWMVNQGCDIIVDDLLFFNEPMFEDGPIAEAAQDAVDSGVLYVTSAGNNAELHYQGDYIYSSGGYHDFDPGAGLDQTLMFYATYQSRIYGTLQWSDEFGNSGNDYDLSLFGQNGSSWDNLDAYMTGGRLVQNGDDDPLEIAYYDNTSYSTLAWTFKQISGSGCELEFFAYDGGLLNQHPSEDSNDYVVSNSIWGHAAVEDVITVGAIDASDPGNDAVQTYSSQGPSTIYTNFSTQTSTTRNTLDICGIDGVSTKIGDLGYFSDPFKGTSAAAPHIAGIAALLLEIDPDATPAEIESVIQNNADDILTAGYDQVSGYGRADAFACITSVTTAPTGVDLVYTRDTGFDTSDNITMYDNSYITKKLAFQVTGTIDGAEVTLYDGEGDILGTGTGNGGAITIYTNGTHDLADGVNNITAKQKETGKLKSVASSALAITIDTVAPTVSIPNLIDADDTGYSDSDNVTQGVTPTFTGTASDANSGLWKVDVSSNDSKSGSDTTTPASYSVELATLDEAASFGRTVIATAYDIAGNSTQSSSLGLTVDRTAPTAPSIPDLQADSDTGENYDDEFTNDHTPTFDLTGASPYFRFYCDATKISGDWETLSAYTISSQTAGIYNFSVAAVDVAGNESTKSTALSVQIVDTDVEDHHIFINNSVWDGSNAAANSDDDDAIMTSKSVLLPGHASSADNSIKWPKGLTGIMVDIYGLADDLTASDFIFKVSNGLTPDGDSANYPGQWSTAPTPIEIDVRWGEGENGSDRVTIVWADNAIMYQWLEVSVLANTNTGLSTNDVFYFAHNRLVGDANDDGVVSAGDYAGREN